MTYICSSPPLQRSIIITADKLRNESVLFSNMPLGQNYIEFLCIETSNFSVKKRIHPFKCVLVIKCGTC
jgi:hypothetical protein